MEKAPQSNKSVRLHRRYLKNLLIRPSLQFRLWLHSYLYLATALFIIYFVMIQRQDAIVNKMVEKDPYWDAKQSLMLSLFLQDALLVGAISIVLVSITSFLYSIWVSHRVVGPFIPILRLIENLKKGDYGSQVTLRKSDSLGEIADALNGLSQSLKDRHAK